MAFTNLLPDCQLEILRRLITKDLLVFAAVNKYWNVEAYKLIKYATTSHLTSPQLISKLIHLEELDLSFNDRGKAWWFYGLTKEILQLTNLTRIHVEFVDYGRVDIMSPEAIEFFDVLKQMTQLEKISLNTSKIPHLDSFFPGFSKLTSLTLNASFYAVDGAINAHTWKISSQLRELRLESDYSHHVALPLDYATNITNLHVGFGGFSNTISHLTKLKRLSLFKYDEYDSGSFIQTADLTALTQLEHIAVSYNIDLAIDLLTVLPKLVWLTSLELQLSSQDPAQKELIDEISRLVNLTSLKMYTNTFSADNLAHLTKLKRFERGWTPEFMTYLPYLIRLPNLEYLLYGGIMQEEAFETLIKLTSLTALELIDNPGLARVKQNGVLARLLETLPRVRIFTAYNSDLRCDDRYHDHPNK